MKIETPAGRYACASRSDGEQVSRFLSVREQTHLSTIQKGRLKNEPPQIFRQIKDYPDTRCKPGSIS